MAQIKPLSTDNFEQAISGGKTAFIGFGAPWCGHCANMQPVLMEIAQQTDDVDFYGVNIDESPELAERFEIRSIPMLMMFRDGKLVNQNLGALTKDELLKFISDAKA
ncbi:MAG: thioredoxin family protein [Succinivibrio sp.]|nr:thioredoxin family protein [Succinivibrio sp.]